MIVGTDHGTGGQRGGTTLRKEQDKDPEKSNRVMQALMKMHKLDIAELKRAYEQR